jgi:PilZ domain
MNPRPNWFARLFFKDRRDLSQDRRDARRHTASRLEAYYWNGSAPVPHRVRDISSAGAYLVTEDRWHPGTVLMLTLQRTDEYIDGHPDSITLQSKVIRWGIDGVGFVFVFPGTTDFLGWDAYVHGADRKMFSNFVRGIRANK